jgi:hypothetical protein
MTQLTSEDIARLDASAAEEITRSAHTGDREGDHTAADIVVLGVLEALGFSKTVAAWDKVEKWYS